MRTFNFHRSLSIERLETRFVLSADFNGDNIVDASDLEVWQDNYGVTGTATESQGDADGNMDVDGRDFLAWQREFGQSSTPLAAPKGIESRAIGPSSIEVTWQPSVGATNYIVIRRQPDTEPAYTVIAANVSETSYVDTELVSGTLYEYRVAALGDPQPTFTPPTQSSAGRANLTAYRPQSVHPLENPVDAPIYTVKKSVLEVSETSNFQRIGIRINRDDDNNNGTSDALESGIEIPRENDLIEVKIDRLPGQGDLVLNIGIDLTVYYNHDKQTPIPMMNASQSRPLEFENNQVTVFVEWVHFDHGASNLSLVETSTSTTLDTLRFHTFRSLVIIFGGLGQNPADTDGDGSMGDQVEEDDVINREGIFDLATLLYDQGWDVLAFNEEAVDDADDIPFTEALSAVENRRVSSTYGGGLAIMGYSQGGGAAHDLIERLFDVNEQFPIITTFGLYLDAVVHDFPLGFPEDDWPDVVFYLLSIRQEISILRGADIDDNEVIFGAELEEINTTTDGSWDTTLNHYTIDDSPLAHSLVINRLGQYFFER